jgi:hypothetical protein
MGVNDGQIPHHPRPGSPLAEEAEGTERPELHFGPDASQERHQDQIDRDPRRQAWPARHIWDKNGLP